MSILKRLSELLAKQARLSDELGDVNLEIARSEDELLRTWLERHPEHRRGELIDYTITCARRCGSPSAGGQSGAPAVRARSATPAGRWKCIAVNIPTAGATSQTTISLCCAPLATSSFTGNSGRPHPIVRCGAPACAAVCNQ